jgi:hypothetical protein
MKPPTHWLYRSNRRPTIAGFFLRGAPSRLTAATAVGRIAFAKSHSASYVFPWID